MEKVNLGFKPCKYLVSQDNFGSDSLASGFLVISEPVSVNVSLKRCLEECFHIFLLRSDVFQSGTNIPWEVALFCPFVFSHVSMSLLLKSLLTTRHCHRHHFSQDGVRWVINSARHVFASHYNWKQSSSSWKIIAFRFIFWFSLNKNTNGLH